MLRVLLLGAFTIGVATLTFALMALGSLQGVAHRSNTRSPDSIEVRRWWQGWQRIRPGQVTAHRRECPPGPLAGSGSEHN